MSRLIFTLFYLLSLSAAFAQELQGTLHRRSYFYTGASYVNQGNLTLAHGQMYIERLTPIIVNKTFPIVFVHGQGMTGTNLLNTPDGRPGWADFLLSKGYEVYLVDQPGRARSAWLQGIDGNQTSFDVLETEQLFTASERFDLWPRAHLHTQWPGNGSQGDPVFDEFYASTVPSLGAAEQDNKTRNAGSELLDRIGPAILLTHSMSGQIGWVLADARPSLVKAIVALEPNGPPFINVLPPPPGPARAFGLTDVPLTYSPPISSAADLQKAVLSNSSFVTCFEQAEPARQLVNLVNIPMLVVSSESSFHAEYDNCTANYLRQAGVQSVNYTRLEEVGIRGNGHMMFMEKNSDQIVSELIEPWIAQF